MNSINNIIADFQNIKSKIIHSKMDFSSEIDIDNPTSYDYAIDYEVINSKLEHLEYDEESVDFYTGEIKFFLKLYELSNQKYKNPSFKNIIPFIEIISTGTFAGNANVLDNDMFDRMLVQNGLIYLSQFVRVHLLAITSTIGISGNFSLPMINIVQFIQENEKEKSKKK
ncbi:hypothetical protein [Proteocatella sphenisci]|uniref:hypothetical protein n=1 Tax=Proteocatella sphenisci TaxID=181070 RepID=UPI000490AD56|nr:hypothetical protein [Proteocatella sphenisci]